MVWRADDGKRDNACELLAAKHARTKNDAKFQHPMFSAGAAQCDTRYRQIEAPRPGNKCVMMLWESMLPYGMGHGQSRSTNNFLHHPSKSNAKKYQWTKKKRKIGEKRWKSHLACAFGNDESFQFHFLFMRAVVARNHIFLRLSMSLSHFRRRKVKKKNSVGNSMRSEKPTSERWPSPLKWNQKDKRRLPLQHFFNVKAEKWCRLWTPKSSMRFAVDENKQRKNKKQELKMQMKKLFARSQR